MSRDNRGFRGNERRDDSFRRDRGFNRDDRGFGGRDFDRGYRGFERRDRDFRRDDSERRDDRGFKRNNREHNDRDFKRRDDRSFKRRNDRGDSSGRGAGSRDSYGRGGTRGAGRSDRSGVAREFTETERIAHELRPVRERHNDPLIPSSVTIKDLAPAARNQLKTLEKENAELVGRHLAMVAELIDIDPETAHQHAISAARRAGRIPVARETLAMTAYRLHDFALALREFHTYTRLSGGFEHIGMMVDCERGLDRPERAVELAAIVDTDKLGSGDKVRLAIALSGAYLDMQKPDLARAELETLEFSNERAYDYSPELFRAYALVLEETGEPVKAAEWLRDADRAAAALVDHTGGDQLVVFDSMASCEELEETGVLAELRAEADAVRMAKEAAEAVVAEAEEAAADADTATDAEPDETESDEAETVAVDAEQAESEAGN
ncbi:hypothetical protein KJY77_04345 [Canibacter sp. lx-72]|uniref:hypothetical protein n=1 Tax=Canibacter zhuwentaonis TaxID=2837491 RepID=UPI001BDD9ED8|nr:hypothetical protein [Canibacter zhuwentaonis]MBT1018370.1 hypothetical protein [Canibacter zhuwentaonis]